MNAASRPISVPHSAEEDLVFLLSRLGAVTRSRLAETLSEFSLTPRQFLVLKTLSAHNGLSQTELSDRLGIDTSSIVRVIDECEQDSLAARERSPQDRRRYAVQLTPKGRRIVRSAQAGVEDFSNELLGTLKQADRETLRALLVTVAAAHEPRPGKSGRQEATLVG